MTTPGEFVVEKAFVEWPSAIRRIFRAAMPLDLRRKNHGADAPAGGDSPSALPIRSA
jgi:hypothetical protein